MELELKITLKDSLSLSEVRNLGQVAKDRKISADEQAVRYIREGLQNETRREEGGGK